jgi:hypothetical protein
LWRLARRQVNITSIEAHQAILTLPEEDADLKTRMDAFIAYLDKEDGGGGDSGGLEVQVDAIEIEHLTVRRGKALAASGTIRADQPFSDTPRVEIKVSAPYVSPGAQFEAALRFTNLPDAPTRMQGTASLKNVGLNTVFGIETWPTLTADVLAEIDGALPGEIALEGGGEVSLATKPKAIHGEFRAKGWWRENQLVVNDGTLNAPGLKASVDVTWPPGGETALRIASASFAAPALSALLNWISPENPHLDARGDAVVSVSEMLIGFPSGEAVRFASGEIALSGIDLTLPDGTRSFPGIAGKGTVREGTLEISELTSEGVRLAGSVRPDFQAGSAVVDVHGSVQLSREQLGPWLPLETVHELAGTLDLQRLSGTFSAAAFPPPDLAVQTQLQGLSASVDLPGQSAPVALHDVAGGVSMAEGKVQLDHVSGQGLTVHGTLHRDPANGQVRVDLTGEADLASPLLGLLLPPDTFKELQGKATFQRIAGTFVPGEGLPADLVVDGAVAGGAATVALPARPERLEGIAATFASKPEGVEAEIRVNSASVGQMQWKGLYAHQTRALGGTLWVNLDQGASPFLPPGQAQAYLSAVLRAYGSSGLDITAKLPGPNAPGAVVDLARQGTPALTAHAEFMPQGKELGLAALRLQADIPAEWLSQALPPRVSAEGLAHFELTREPAAPGFQAELNLDAVDLTAGRYLHKRAGGPASIRLAGGTPEDAWSPQRLGITLLDESLEFTPQGERWSTANLDIDLAVLIPLLPEGASAAGKISGSISTEPVTAALRLEKAGIALAPEIAIDSVEGLLAYRDGYWTCQNLRLLGAASDCTMTAGFRGPSWHVNVTGPKLNVNALAAMGEAFAAFQQNAPLLESGADTAPVEPLWTQSISGAITMNIQEVLYRRGRINDVHADIAFDPESVSMDNVSMGLYSGAMKGSLRLARGPKGQPGEMAVKFALDNADLRILDELLFDESRAITGAISGNVDLRFPYGAGAQPFNGLNGLAVFTATDGSYGRMGFATTLLFFLKTTEILRLRLPSLTDKGLTFKTSSGKMVMENGVMTIQEFAIVDRAYTMVAQGLVNFPQDRTDVKGKLHPLESVTGLVGKIPLVGDTLGLLKKTTGIPLYASGSPFNPTIRIEPGVRTGKDVKNAAEKAAESLGL